MTEKIEEEDLEYEALKRELNISSTSSEEEDDEELELPPSLNLFNFLS